MLVFNVSNTLVAAKQGVGVKGGEHLSPYYLAYICINCSFINVFYLSDLNVIIPCSDTNKYKEKIPNLKKELVRIYQQILTAANLIYCYFSFFCAFIYHLYYVFLQKSKCF